MDMPIKSLKELCIQNILDILPKDCINDLIKEVHMPKLVIECDEINKYIKVYSIRTYYLLILNSYKSYKNTNFNNTYIKKNIILYYILSYLLYLL